MNNPALEYLANNWLPIPLRVGEKVPACKWMGLQELRPPFTQAFAQPWVQRPQFGIALLLRPSRLCVIDCDSEAAVAEAMNLCRERCNNIVISRKGAHFYYRLPEGVPPLRRIQCGNSKKIDIMADGYMAAPPSVHPSGHRYEWVSQGPLQDAPEWACKLLSEVKVRSITALGITPEDALNAWPHTEKDMQALQIALKAINPLLYNYLAMKETPVDRSRALWLLTNTLIRLRLRKSATVPEKLDDKSIAKIVWYGALGEKPRQRGWNWLCDEISRARLELTPD